MSSILVIGYDARTVPGLDAEAIHSGVEAELERLREQGVHASLALVVADGSAEGVMRDALSQRDWDVVVVGAGIRRPDELVGLFEEVVESVRRFAPGAKVAFNTHPGDTAEAALRHL
ncbi:hypothetical protein [Streptomyces cacaoi]|uniref:hypothetical protein n=1 Tax=Streptomyces cacaoi TaxID=1898 RepID=UPI0011F1E09D|nr:hypothetical protein [Streptomyces cacaoi]